MENVDKTLKAIAAARARAEAAARAARIFRARPARLSDVSSLDFITLRSNLARRALTRKGNGHYLYGNVDITKITLNVA